MKQQSVLTLFGLFLLFGYDKVTPIVVDEAICGLSDVNKETCPNKSVTSPLNYIMKLKEQIKATTQENLERENEVKTLMKGLFERNESKDQVKVNNQQIEELRKISEDLRSSIGLLKEFITYTINNQKSEIVENLKLNECLANQDNLKNELELIRNQTLTDQNQLEEVKKIYILIEQKYAGDLENLKSEAQKELDEHNAKEETLKIEKTNLKSQVSSNEKQLEECQNQLADKNRLVDSLKWKQIATNLTNCSELIRVTPKSSCSCQPSGIHLIEVSGLNRFPALCNRDISDGGWIVIQKRFDGSVNFNRSWSDYRSGFGRLDGEFFIGLEILHRITNSESYELYIQLGYFDGTFQFARYTNFVIGNEDSKYSLNSLGEFDGTTNDQMKVCINQKFSTFDQDNDIWYTTNCALQNQGGWWYNYCASLNPNGKYYNRAVDLADSMHWNLKPLKSMQMLIRPKSND